MVALTGVTPQAETHLIPIETMRAIAVILLVAYHVIGPEPASGLKIGYPNMLRLYADFFVDVRMPFFAFIAGYVYAIRPPSVAGYRAYIWHKARRLALPGGVATGLFVLTAILLGNRFALPLDDAWRPFLFSYAHFWFLQAILLIFLLYGFVDAVLGGRFSAVLLLISVVLFAGKFNLPTSFLSINSVTYLLPFFLFGVVFCRYGEEIWAEAERLTILLLILALVCAFWNIRELIETGTFSLHKRDWQSLAFGLAVCALAFLWCPRLPLLEKVSPYAFSIYLYHIFGTVAARTLGNSLGLTAPEPRFVLGVAGGLLVPIILHKIVQRQGVASTFMLGR